MQNLSARTLGQARHELPAGFVYIGVARRELAHVGTEYRIGSQDEVDFRPERFTLFFEPEDPDRRTHRDRGKSRKDHADFDWEIGATERAHEHQERTHGERLIAPGRFGEQIKRECEISSIGNSELFLIC